jgi:hypothetical protein
VKKIFLLFLIFATLAAFATFSFLKARAAREKSAATKIEVKTGTWTTPVGTLDLLQSALESNSTEQEAADLYNLMTEDFRSSFDMSNFNYSNSGNGIKVISSEITEQNDEWAKGKMKLLIGGEEKEFTVILKNESGFWRLYGTEEI